ncbi:hypothetical protein Hanom_Chr15g01398711 [Helianthus anomalus]
MFFNVKRKYYDFIRVKTQMNILEYNDKLKYMNMQRSQFVEKHFINHISCFICRFAVVVKY